MLSKTPCLAYFDTTKQLIISADASGYGIGSCLFQVDTEGNREPVAYISRTLTPTERLYAQIEKEALGLTWAADKFAEYIIGLKIILETDHKPLVQILQTKNLDNLTPRLQRFRIRLMRYDYTVQYVPGKELVVADTLSRSPLTTIISPDELGDETRAYVNLVTDNLPVKDEYLKKIIFAQRNDHICKILKEYSINGWPERHKITPEMVVYFQYRHEISFVNELLLKNSRIIIPPELQKEVIEFIHLGHQGITKCRRRALGSVWWLGLSSQHYNLVKNCPNCIEERTNPKDYFHKGETPTRPMEIIGTDLYKCLGKWYLIITDYYSRFFEIFELSSMTEDIIIEKLKEIFSRYGICNILRSDNGPQFQNKFYRFSLKYNFKHITSSPYYSQSNGEVESAVKTAKSLIKKNRNELDLALLSYRTTPLENGFSPAELMMRRKLKNFLPQLETELNFRMTEKEISQVQKKESVQKHKQITNYNKRHNSKKLSFLDIGEGVWVIDLRQYGKVINRDSNPRSYIIRTESGTYRRNRWYLIPAPFVNRNNFGHSSPQPDPVLKTLFPEKERENANIHNNNFLFGNSSIGNSNSSVAESLLETNSDSIIKTESHSCDKRSDCPRPNRVRRPPVRMQDYK